jgi:hypothetical protein
MIAGGPRLGPQPLSGSWYGPIGESYGMWKAEDVTSKWIVLASAVLVVIDYSTQVAMQPLVVVAVSSQGTGVG